MRNLFKTMLNRISNLFALHRSILRMLSITALGAAGLALPVMGAEPVPKPLPGLILEVQRGNVRDYAVVPELALHVPTNQPVTPFVTAGDFTALLTGHVTLDLRTDYYFEANLNGSLKLEINGETIFDLTTNGSSGLTKTFQLNKGPNALKATFRSPKSGAAFFRVHWSEKDYNLGPIPTAMLTHGSAGPLTEALQVREGRELFLEHRCVRCHSDGNPATGALELAMDAPHFEGIGARRQYDWLARWVANPHALRPDARMPQVLHGPKVQDDADAIASYLSTLTEGGKVTFNEVKPAAIIAPPEDAGEVHQFEEPKTLFTKLHCAACHQEPGIKEEAPGKISLAHVAEKFPAGKLEEFLRKPEAHYTWIRMPNFRLTEAEAHELTTNLLAAATKPANVRKASTDTARIAHGKRLVQSSGCLSCHEAKLENQFKGMPLAKLTAESWTRGCLAPGGSTNSTAPHFGFSDAQRAALRRFGTAHLASLQRHVPTDFAARQVKNLNCVGCHGQFEEFPALNLLGGKLKPAWAAAFIAGEIAYKPRAERHPKGEPWLFARMPGFKPYAKALAEGMAMQHGYAPTNPVEKPVDQEMAKIGHKLIGKDGGLSCISCHGIGKMPAVEVFESEGINLAYTADRLREDYYFRWMHNPIAIDPQTKMPAFFEDNRSGLTDIYDGSGEKQIGALWEYIRLRDKMPLPAVPQ